MRQAARDGGRACGVASLVRQVTSSTSVRLEAAMSYSASLEGVTAPLSPLACHIATQALSEQSKRPSLSAVQLTAAGVGTRESGAGGRHRYRMAAQRQCLPGRGRRRTHRVHSRLVCHSCCRVPAARLDLPAGRPSRSSSPPGPAQPPQGGRRTGPRRGPRRRQQGHAETAAPAPRAAATRRRQPGDT
jgi:hypothetical protein